MIQSNNFKLIKFRVIYRYPSNNRRKSEILRDLRERFPTHAASGVVETRVQTEIYTRPPSANPQIIRGRTSINSP